MFKKTIAFAFLLILFSCSKDGEKKTTPESIEEDSIESVESIPLEATEPYIIFDDGDDLLSQLKSVFPLPITGKSSIPQDALERVFEINSDSTKVSAFIKVKDNYSEQYKIENIIPTAMDILFKDDFLTYLILENPNLIWKAYGEEVSNMMNILCLKLPDYKFENKGTVYIPITFHNLEGSSWTANNIDYIIEKLNVLFSDAKIQFEHKQTVPLIKIDNTIYNYLNVNNGYDFNYDEEAINIYVANNIGIGSPELVNSNEGIAHFPVSQKNTNSIFIKSIYLDERYDEQLWALSHELGHMFTLLHTFDEFNYNIIPNCQSLSWTDDGISLTPEANIRPKEGLDCSDDLITNVMSYSFLNKVYRPCFRKFEKEQNIRMRFAAEEWLSDIIVTDAETNNIFIGNIQLRTQQEVNEFGANNYSEIDGLLTIGTYDDEVVTSDISDLSPLSSLTKVKNLEINNNTQLTKLEGLQNVLSIEETLFIYKNGISNLNGLSGLTTINSLTISQNSSLMNLSGLSAQLINVGYLSINNNLNLNSLDGLSNITSIGSNFWLTDNNSLIDLKGLENLTSVVEALRIENNTSLKTLEGLQGLNSIGNNFEITGNTSLADFCVLQNYLSSTSLTPFINNNEFNPTKQDIIEGACTEASSTGEIGLSDFNFNATVFSTSNVLRNYSFSQDGLHLYMSIDGDIHHYILPSPYNLSSLNTPNEVLGLNTSQGGSSLAKDVVVNQDGTIMYVQADRSGNFNPDYFQQYSLSTPYSIGSASYINRIELNSKYNKMELSNNNSKLYIAYHDFFSTIFREIREFEFATSNDITSISVINATPQIYDNGQTGAISFDIVDDFKSIYVTDDLGIGLTKKFVMNIQGDINSIDSEQPQSSTTLGQGERIIKVVGNEEKFFTLVNSGGSFSIKEYVRN